MRHITVIAEVGSTIAYFTVHESAGGLCSQQGEQGVTIRGLTFRYGLGERELNIVRALKFNESVSFDLPDARSRLASAIGPDKQVSIAQLCALASALKSEAGENPEYDRALIELVTDAAGLPMDCMGEIAKRIGIAS